ncbi:MAG: hypothetical protein EOO54_11955 [Haliea sp.]|nr:MAG: hypothetical protein EOO54_11955 [Haliea sp.]
MKQLLLPALLATACSLALAKLPVPVLDDAAKAKAAEAAAKAAWTGKVDAYQLCKVQDKVAAHYRKTATSLAAGATAAPAKDAKPGSGAAAAASAPAPAASGAGTATTVAGAPTPTPCADPGAFAYTPPEQKPLEASGAHSPTGNAVSPPSTTTPAAATAPAKKS